MCAGSSEPAPSLTALSLLLRLLYDLVHATHLARLCVLSPATDAVLRSDAPSYAAVLVLVVSASHAETLTPPDGVHAVVVLDLLLLFA